MYFRFYVPCIPGKTEQGANAERWKVIVLKDSNIVNEIIVNSELEAHKKMMQFVSGYVEGVGESFSNVPKAKYLDSAKKNLGIKFEYGLSIFPL